jgi:hypothetical protein
VEGLDNLRPLLRTPDDSSWSIGHDVDVVDLSAMVAFPNPLQLLTDQELYDSQLMLALACGRNKAVTHNKHRTKACALFDVLALEAGNRGRPSPQWPYRA